MGFSHLDLILCAVEHLENEKVRGLGRFFSPVALLYLFKWGLLKQSPDKINKSAREERIPPLLSIFSFIQMWSIDHINMI